MLSLNRESDRSVLESSDRPLSPNQSPHLQARTMRKALSLEKYPDAIYRQQKKLHKIERELQVKQDEIAVLDLEIELEIANDPDLRNETMRKTKRSEMRQSQDYIDIKIEIDKINNSLAEGKIELEFIRNNFTVSKLNKREAIAALNQSFELVA